MAVVFALCAAYVAYCLGTNPAGPFTTPDSIHYLNATPIVPLGYPFFLKVFGASGAMVVQPILFAGALAFLGREIARLARSTWLAVAVVAGSMLLPQIRQFHASILSESLFLTALVVFLGLSVRFAYHPTWHLMVLVATTAGVGATVRRTAFALVPVMLAMVLIQRQRLRGSQTSLFLIAALAPLLAIIGAEQAAAPIVHTGQSSSLLGRHMFAKAALIEAPPAPPSADRLRAGLNEQLEIHFAPIRTVLAAAPTDVRAVLATYYETCLQGGCADDARRLMPGLTEPEQTGTLGAVGLARIRRAPLAFLQLTAMSYRSLWTVDRTRHPDRAAAITAFVAAHRPMPFERMALALAPEHVFAFQPSARVRYMQWLMTAVAIWTGAIAAAGVIGVFTATRLPPPFAIAAIAALSAHGCLLLTAVLATGFSRFTLGVWPAIAMALVFGIWAVLPARWRQALERGQ
jgi:hypothetical protein